MARITEGIDMAERRVAFRLPLPGLPRALFVTDYGLNQGQLLVDDTIILTASSHEAIVRGVSVTLPGTERQILVQAEEDEVRLSLDGAEVRREDRLRAPSSRSAWLHGWIALAGSAFGFAASYLYVLRANSLSDPWSMRMALHMAAWHLLLTLTLFPASVWGQRAGIRAVQAMSLVFFFIHLGIALSNSGSNEQADGPFIALFNALSGFAFLVAVLYGQRAHADMDPLSDVHPERAVVDMRYDGDSDSSASGARHIFGKR
jgi:hypothetical protein